MIRSGPLPLVQVTMGGNGSAKLNDGTPRNVTVGPVKGGITRDGKVIRPQHAPQLAAHVAQAPQPALPPPSAFMPEQLMLCRHLVGEYMKAQQEIVDAEGTEEDARATATANVELAEASIASIDAALAPPVIPARRPLPAVIVDHRAQAGANRRIAAPGAPPPVIVSMDEAPAE